MAYLTDDDKWRAVTARDAAADGLFVYGVRTTRIYCRPNCKARLARRANVRYYANPHTAEAAGYRACKRCKPRTEGGMPEDEAVARIRALVGRQHTAGGAGGGTGVCAGPAAALASPSMLASQARVSRWHFHRKFKEVTGQTPRAYLKQRERERKAREAAAAVVVEADQNHMEVAGFAVAPHLNADIPADVPPTASFTATTTPSTDSDDLFELAAADGTPLSMAMPDLALLFPDVASHFHSPGHVSLDAFHSLGAGNISNTSNTSNTNNTSNASSASGSPLNGVDWDAVDMDALYASSSMDPLFTDPALWGDLASSAGGAPGSLGGKSTVGSGSSSSGGVYGGLPGYYMDGSLFEAVPMAATAAAMPASTTATTYGTIHDIHDTLHGAIPFMGA
ncbi:hypothetical protein SPBR_05072 [Sporothrix brasiliensis 5110]|uniref:Uncharacterized protein n=1 Tax=Sporothrix brasiliensis 5110 TaxID=1398154 RepID=A0A0C2IQ22_9PEZI|nr:uncharacterized protein SPBR_05072 [Sporothrix brasiliensis 5110]KIH87137.1 hypothetical protein SPBR_05072 [Sporothrix brasiliensis 5110]